MVLSRNTITSSEGAPQSRVVRRFDRMVDRLTCRARAQRVREIQASVVATWQVRCLVGLARALRALRLMRMFRV
jgi:hypothetical protein